MKQSPWHITLFFAAKRHFILTFQVLLILNSQLLRIVPLFQMCFRGFGLNTSARRRCQLIGLHFRTFRGYISSLEWEDTPCFTSLNGLMEMRWSWPWTPPLCSTNNSLTSFLYKKESVLVRPTVVSDVKKQRLEVTFITCDYNRNSWHYCSASLRVYNYLSGEWA